MTVKTFYESLHTFLFDFYRIRNISKIDNR